MTKLFITLLSFSLLLFFYGSCRSTKYQSPTDFPDRQIIFGSGGGIAGLVKTYTLLENGQLFKSSTMDSTYTALKASDKKRVSQVFNNYTFMGIDKINMNAPGNMYYFIEYKDKEAKVHKITWGLGESPQEEANLNLFYSQLLSLVPKSK